MHMARFQLICVLLCGFIGFVLGVQTLDAGRGSIKTTDTQLRIKLNNNSSEKYQRQIGVHLSRSNAQNKMSIKVGTDSSCNSVIASTTSETQYAIIDQRAFYSNDAPDAIYVCISGITVGSTVDYVAYYGVSVRMTDTTESLVNVEYLAKTMENDITYSEFAVHQCERVNEGGKDVAKLLLKDFRDANNNSVSASDDNVKRVLNDYVTFYISHVEMSQEYEATPSANVYQHDYADIVGMENSSASISIPLPDDVKDHDIFFVRLALRKCKNFMGIGCPTDINFDVYANFDDIRSMGHYTGVRGDTLYSFDEEHAITPYHHYECPYLVRANLSYTPETGVFPTPKRIVLWTGEDYEDLKVQGIVANTSAASRIEYLKYLPNYNNKYQTGISASSGEISQGSDKTLMFGFEPERMYAVPVVHTERSRTMRYRSRVGYTMDRYYAFYENDRSVYRKWNKFAFGITPSVFRHIANDPPSELDKYCVTATCEASDPECDFNLHFQASGATTAKSGYMMSLGSNGTKSAMYCFDKNSVDASQYGYLFPLHKNTNEWTTLTSELIVRMDYIPFSQPNLTDGEFSANAGDGLLGISLTPALLDALQNPADQKKKQLSLSLIVRDEHGDVVADPAEKYDLTYDLQASQICPWASHACKTIVDYKEGKYAIAAESINTEFPDLLRLFVLVNILTFPDEFNGTLGMNFKIENQIVDIIDDDDTDNDGGSSSGGDNTDVPDNDNDKEDNGDNDNNGGDDNGDGDNHNGGDDNNNGDDNKDNTGDDNEKKKESPHSNTFFSNNAVPFTLSTGLIIVAVVGVVVYIKKRRAKSRTPTWNTFGSHDEGLQLL